MTLTQYFQSQGISVLRHLKRTDGKPFLEVRLGWGKECPACSERAFSDGKHYCLGFPQELSSEERREAFIDSLDIGCGGHTTGHGRCDDCTTPVYRPEGE